MDGLKSLKQEEISVQDKCSATIYLMTLMITAHLLCHDFEAPEKLKIQILLSNHYATKTITSPETILLQHQFFFSFFSVKNHHKCLKPYGSTNSQSSTKINVFFFFSVSDTVILGKRNSEFSQQESNLRPSDY